MWNYVKLTRTKYPEQQSSKKNAKIERCVGGIVQKYNKKNLAIFAVSWLLGITYRKNGKKYWDTNFALNFPWGIVFAVGQRNDGKNPFSMQFHKAYVTNTSDFVES